MAFPTNPFDLDTPAAQPQANEPLRDTAREFTGSLLDTGAQAAGVVGALRRTVSKANVPTSANPTGGPTPEDDRFASGMEDVQGHLNAASDVVKGAMSSTGKAVSEADWTTSEGLKTKLSHPIQSLAQGTAQLAPVLLGATMLPEGWAGVAAGSAFFGTQGVAAQMNATRKKVMNTPDDDLQSKVPLYRALREDYDEPTARQKLVEAQNDVRGLLTTGGANALAGGALGHLLRGPATTSFLKSIGVGAGEAALGLGVAGGGSEAGQQMGEQATGERGDMDPEKIALAALNGGATGALIGGIAGTARGLALPRRVRSSSVERDAQSGRMVEPGAPDPAQKAALDAEQGGTQPPAAPGKGTLAEQIAQEEQAPAPAPTPAEAPPAPAPVVRGQGAEPPVPQPPPSRPATQQPVPMPPTDRTNMPPRPKLPTERMAVPLEEPPVAERGGVTRAEAQDITSALPKREDVVPATEPVVASEPIEPKAPPVQPELAPPPVVEPGTEHIQALNDAVAQKSKPAAEPAEVTPPEKAAPKEQVLEPAELVATTGEGKKIFQVKNALTELVKEARAKEAEDAKRQENARERTPSSKELSEQGVKNPTPYLSRLIEVGNFLRLHKIARETLRGNPARLEARMKELFTEHVKSERALRAGDLQAAAERRLEANERRNARHRAGRVKEEAQRTAAEQEELDKLTREQGDEPSESFSRITTREEVQKRATHYDIPKGQPERISTAGPELIHLASEFDPQAFGAPRHKAMATLMQQIMRRLADRIGHTEMRFVSDLTKKIEVGLGRQEDGGHGIGGFFRFFEAGKTREGERGVIYIDNDLVHTVEGPQVILHEAMHAATNHAIDHNPRLRADLEAVRQEADAAYKNVHGEQYEYGLHAENKRSGFPDVREFVAEAWAKPRLRNLLVATPASRELVQRLGLGGQKTSLWRAMIVSISRALGLGEKHYTLMDAIAHLTDEAMAYEPPRVDTVSTSRLHHFHEGDLSASQSNARFLDGRRTAEDLTRAIEDAPHITATLQSQLRALGIKLSTTHQLAQMAERHFGPGSPVMKLWNAAKKMAHMKGEILEQSGAKKLVGKVAALDRKLTPERMEEFGNFLRDETMAGVFADRPLKGQGGVTSQGKAQYDELAARYAKLSPEEKSLRNDLHNYFKSQQQEAGLATLKAVIRAINPNGEADDALAQKIFDNKLSDAEKRVLDRHHVMRAIRNARAMSRINGPYIPLMRHGDHVVSGTYDVPAPKGGTRLDEEGKLDAKGNVYQFDTKAAATAFAEQAPVKVTREQHVYVDPTTGERTAVDPATGEKTRLTKEDWAANTADEKWRVTLQPKHVEFFESETEARRRYAELKAHDFAKEGVGFALDGVAPRRYEPTGKNASFMSLEWDRALNSLRQRGGFQALDANARREMENHLVELSLSSLGSTRIQSRRLPRTFVRGASSDIQKGLGQYASAMSGFLARQRYAPEVDQLMKQLVGYQEAHKYQASEHTYPRGQILKELQQRLYAAGEPERNSAADTVIGRLLQMSQLDKLASPAFHVINSMEPWTTSMPVIAGKYGFGKTIAAMHRAYADIGAPTIIGKGLADTARALRSSEGLTDYIKTLSDRVSDKPLGREFSDVIREMGELGVISRDAGMEVGRMSNPASNIVGRGLDRADLMARQMGTAIESINRFVTARAEYTLARESGLGHEAAKQAAIDRVVNTMGDYSQWNAAPIFNSQFGRLALQFKKFAQKTYYILGKTALAGLRGDPEGMKAFAGLMATHGLLAGALGLPLEAIHAGMLAAQLTGLSQNNYGDFEQAIRGIAARTLGVGFGEIATRGLPRYLGVDVSSRFSLADLVFPLGDPKSLKRDDLLAYAAKAFGGAPLSLLAEYPGGVEALMKGDVAEASRVLVPLKIYSDSMTAYQRSSTGRTTASGREKLSPYTPGEAVTRSLGFTPGREAETMEAYNAQYGDQQRFKQDRSALMSAYVNGKGGAKADALRAINEWNAKQPPAAKITPGEAERAVIRRQREEHDEKWKGGLHTTKRDQHVRDQEKFYNLH